MSDNEAAQEESPVDTPDQTDSLQSPEGESVAEQPRTLGGFIVDDEDDDEGIPKPSAQVESLEGFKDVNHRASNPPQLAALFSPSQFAQSTSDAPVQTSVQDQHQTATVSNGVAGDVPLASVPAVHDSKDSSAVESSKAVSTELKASKSPTQDLKSLPRARLPHDRVGILEDRIKEDPRGDIDAWISLINDYKRRNKIEDVRNVYERFLEVFPTAAEHWMAYTNFEIEMNTPQSLYNGERLFNRSLTVVPNLQLWVMYLNYVRRRNKLTSDPNNAARSIVSQAFDFVMSRIGIDKDSGPLWQDYIQFIKSGPGQVGGSSWQDQQKMDELRKAFHRAVSVPTQSIQALWKEYDAFEMGLNKMTARKFMQERSPSYIQARTSYTALQNITKQLNRSTMPKLPPALGFEGDVEYMHQVDIWKKWIAWEKEDPLVLKEEAPTAFRERVLFAYNQAVMTMRFWPEFWYEAAEFCFDNNLDEEGKGFLERGAKANPESCLIAFKRADRIESTTTNEEDEESIKRRGELIREPYNIVLDALYDMGAKLKQRETAQVAKIEEKFSQEQEELRQQSNDDEDEDNELEQRQESLEAQKKFQIEALQKGTAMQTRLVNKSITFAWIALMRSIRRVQGKGAPGALIAGSRGVFADARKRGRLTSDMYVASALMEYSCYQDLQVSTKIFERGMKLYPDDENVALEYIKHLLQINDITNARAVFESTVSKFAQKDETKQKAKPIYEFFHDYESQYGELSQVKNLEKRMTALFPGESKSTLFSHRFSKPSFDPIAIRLLVSPAVQAKGKIVQSIEAQIPSHDSPIPSIANAVQIGNSPKRPLEDSENEGPPRKVSRAESPLKGAAGRRLETQKKTHLRNEMQANGSGIMPPPMKGSAPPVPPLIWNLLNILPRAELWSPSLARFDPAKIVELLRNTDLSKTQVNDSQSQTPGPPGMGSSMAGIGQIPQIPQMPTQYPSYGLPGGNSMFGYSQ